jgi:hypothetical protein
MHRAKRNPRNLCLYQRKLKREKGFSLLDSKLGTRGKYAVQQQKSAEVYVRPQKRSKHEKCEPERMVGRNRFQTSAREEEG